ncbi:MAG: hypothetical protein ACU841_08605 [Gammaproteobacteria bacterium]
MRNIRLHQRKNRQRNGRAFPEFHLDPIRSFPADRFQDAGLAPFSGAEARRIVPGEKITKASTAAEKTTIIVPPRQLKIES